MHVVALLRSPGLAHLLNMWLFETSLVDDQHVAIFMAWPYANGPLHLGHIAGNCLPADIQYKYERMRGRRVLMLSGSDEHGTPITVTADETGKTPQEIVDENHEIILDSLLKMGCSWGENVDSRGADYGGALYGRTSDPRHHELVQGVILELHEKGFLERKTMEQFCSIRENGTIQFLPDRYVHGKCPRCSSDGARGDQCDSCGSTYEAEELIEPVSKLNPEDPVEIRETDHLFFRLDLLQEDLEHHASERQRVWKPNVRSMTKNWLDMGLRPRAVTRDIEWGVSIPLDDDVWASKRVYVWFDAVQGYLTCARIWGEQHANMSAEGTTKDIWKKWWIGGNSLKHVYFMGKDNIPFHTIIWPAILLALNTGKEEKEKWHLEDNVASNEYLMLSGDQFSTSRKHAVWLPTFLERYDPDSLRYHLTINMPELHDTDFRWDEFVERINSELIGNYGNYVNRVLSLVKRASIDGKNPIARLPGLEEYPDFKNFIEKKIKGAMDSMERQRFKEALRKIMDISQEGNGFLQRAEPWKYLRSEDPDEIQKALLPLSAAWHSLRILSILTYPYMPFQSERLWEMIGEPGNPGDLLWDDAMDSGERPSQLPESSPLFTRLDLESILSLEESTDTMNNEGTHIEGVTIVDFETFASVDLRIGKVMSVDDHPNADRLYVVKISEGDGQERTVCAGLKDHYTRDNLNGSLVVFVANLAPRKIRGVMSDGMLLAADDGAGSVRLLRPDGDIAPGSNVR
ncbi:MAG: methionine--tRNA ligase [Euryarchaeota archaeon]|nr:methionine--tRNA ligase [Euryarchaeota archaeon]